MHDYVTKKSKNIDNELKLIYICGTIYVKLFKRFNLNFFDNILM